VDGILAVLVLAFAVRGWIRGFVSQLFAGLGILAALWVAGSVSQWVGNHWFDARPTFIFGLIRVLVVVTTALAVAALFQWLGSLTRDVLRGGPLGVVDGPGGMVLGAGFGAAFVAVVLFIALSIPWPDVVPGTVARAKLAAPIMQGAANACAAVSRFSPGWTWLGERFRRAEERATTARRHA
jgi:uncharacterized membrane protein required for colicin V production